MLRCSACAIDGVPVRTRERLRSCHAERSESDCLESRMHDDLSLSSVRLSRDGIRATTLEQSNVRRVRGLITPRIGIDQSRKRAVARYIAPGEVFALSATWWVSMAYGVGWSMRKTLTATGKIPGSGECVLLSAQCRPSC